MHLGILPHIEHAPDADAENVPKRSDRCLNLLLPSFAIRGEIEQRCWSQRLSRSKRGAEFAFQHLDDAPNRRLCDVEPHCRTSVMQVFQKPGKTAK